MKLSAVELLSSCCISSVASIVLSIKSILEESRAPSEVGKSNCCSSRRDAYCPDKPEDSGCLIAHLTASASPKASLVSMRQLSARPRNSIICLAAALWLSLSAGGRYSSEIVDAALNGCQLASEVMLHHRIAHFIVLFVLLNALFHKEFYCANPSWSAVAAAGRLPLLLCSEAQNRSWCLPACLFWHRVPSWSSQHYLGQPPLPPLRYFVVFDVTTALSRPQGST